jgi:sulfofructose kinase
MRLNIFLPEDKSFDVAGMGLNSVDHLVLLPEFPASNSKMEMLRFVKSGGGQVATAVVALSRWGMKTKYIGKVGSDELGEFSLESMRREGIDVSSVIREPDCTNQFAVILVEAGAGERTILWNRDRRLMYREGELRKEDVCSARILHLDGHDIRAAIRCARWAKEDGIVTVLDVDKVEPQTSELLQEIDFVVTSSSFSCRFTGISDRKEAFLKLKRVVPGFLCSTLGQEGAMAFVDGDILHVPGFEAKVIDTTGAGDVFHGGFIYGLLQNWDLEQILRFSNAAAGLKCRDMGGRRGIPTLEEIQKLLEQTHAVTTSFRQA